MSSTVTIFIILFCTIVIPIWLVLHYVTRWRESRSLSQEESRLLEELWKSEREMSERIENLEIILSAEHAGKGNKNG